MNFNAIDTRNVTGMGWSTDRNFYDSLNTDETKEAVEIYRTINGIRVLVDRMDIASPTSEENFDFGESIGEDMRDALPTGSCVEPPSELLEWLDITNIEANTHWIQWSHVNRAWARDINSDMVISPDERNPRYVFSYREVDELTTGGQGFGAVVPDENPALFDETIKDNVPDANTLNFAMQMLQRDNDFEQVGELLNVFMFGHELEFSAAGAAGVYERTKQTFSEFMIDKALVGEKERVNRLHVVPDQIGSDKLGQVVGVGNPDNLRDPLQSIPDLPAGARVIDAFVCDGPGANFEIGIANADDYLGANGFTGKLTPGLLNINTAAQEVMRAIPHNYRLIHELEAPQFNPIVRLPEAIVRYREREIPDGADDKGPNYGDRGADDFLEDINPNTDLDDLRGDRGFASLGELLLLERSATFPGGLGGSIPNPNSNYRISFAGRDPFAATITGESSRISIDLNDVIDASGNIRSDIVSQDVEEQNLLFAGMSNLITTRSDVFTVYFRIRSFKQNPVGSAGVPVWDATDPEYIVDDSRYVMLVDRSEVNRPTDKPKILFLEKLAK